MSHENKLNVTWGESVNWLHQLTHIVSGLIL